MPKLSNGAFKRISVANTKRLKNMTAASLSASRLRDLLRGFLSSSDILGFLIGAGVATEVRV